MNTDVNPFAGYELNQTGGTVDLEDDFDPAGAAGRAARNGSVLAGSDQATASAQCPPPWPGLGPLEPTQDEPTDPPLPEEEGGGGEGRSRT